MNLYLIIILILIELLNEFRLNYYMNLHNDIKKLE